MSNNIQDLFNQQTNIINSINKFNIDYTNYLATCDKRIISPDDPTLPLPSNCANLLTALQAKQSAILADINSFKTKLSNFVPPANYNYDASFNELINMYNKNIKTRNNLDLKLKEIYAADGSIQSEFKLNMDSSVYASIMWSVLATSLIYYVFVKL